MSFRVWVLYLRIIFLNLKKNVCVSWGPMQLPTCTPPRLAEPQGLQQSPIGFWQLWFGPIQHMLV